MSETQTVIELRKIFRTTTGNRKIQLTGDETGASLPTNLAYEPRRATWKGKDALLPGQIQQQAKKKRIKQMAMGGPMMSRGESSSSGDESSMAREESSMERISIHPTNSEAVVEDDWANMLD